MADAKITVEPEAGSDARISEKVVEAVADAEGTSPLDLRPPLYRVVDPDALDKLFSPPSLEHGQPDGEVTFEYRGYEVTVRADGSVSVTDER
ncbi:hypothetical protein BRC81_08010 [Halobacteriales archaeon QS_1_68_20]|nr:MAG: hypothetical protein BRC81_08010 [Halobacteriales archaeon QS_1_68_20]